MMPVPAFRWKAKHTLRQLFHCTYSGTSYCTLVWPAQPCLCQEILPACLWAQTALCKALHQPGKDLCICSVSHLLSTLHSHLLSCDSFSDHAFGCEQKIITFGAGYVRMCVCVRFLLCWISSLVQPTAQLCPVRANPEEEGSHIRTPGFL